MPQTKQPPWRFLLALSLATALPVSGNGLAYVSKQQYGDKWPFTVPDGRLACDNGAVIFFSGPNTYALNGTALTRKDRFGWKDLSEIWRVDEKRWKELKHDPKWIVGVNMGPIIDKGLELCK